MRLIDADLYNELLEQRSQLLRDVMGSLGGAVSGCRALLEIQPTIEATPVVHGRCILQEDGYHCSNCDIQAIYTGVKLKYRPNCGAKMDGGVSDG